MNRWAPFALAAATACGPLLGIEAPERRECASTADCAAKGGAYARAQCTQEHRCQTSCNSNAECGHALDGERALCAGHVCSRVFSDDCKSVVADPEDLAREDVLWFGVLLPYDSGNLPFTIAEEHALDLVLRDFKVASGGLPPLTEGGPRRRFGFVLCDDAIDPIRAARHLVDDLHVPAIIGPNYSGVLVRVATQVTIPRGVLLISPAATSPFITNLAGKNGLVWRTAPSDVVQSVAIASFLKDTLEPEVRAAILKPDEQLHLSVLHKGDAYGVGLETLLFERLVFNGKTAAENGSNYRAIDYGDPSDPADPNPQLAFTQAVDTLLDIAPHVVVFAATGEGIDGVFGPAEKRWTKTAYRPRYIMTDGTYLRTELLGVIGPNTDLRQRVFGTVMGTQSGLYQKFLRSYDSIYSDGTVAIASTAATYDAAYLLAYATAAIGSREVTGASLIEGLKRMVPPGPRIDVGSSAINEALSVLAQGGNIDFNGASGPLDFDVNTGDAEADIQVWCIGADDNGQAANFHYSGLYYDAATKALAGKLECP